MWRTRCFGMVSHKWFSVSHLSQKGSGIYAEERLWESEIAHESKEQVVSRYNSRFPVISQTSDSKHKTCKSSCQQKMSDWRRRSVYKPLPQPRSQLQDRCWKRKKSFFFFFSQWGVTEYINHISWHHTCSGVVRQHTLDSFLILEKRRKIELVV